MTLSIQLWDTEKERYVLARSISIEFDEVSFLATESQTDFSVSPTSFDPSNLVSDVQVFKNGIRMAQDSTGGTLKDFKKVSSSAIRFQYGLKAEDKVTITLPKLVIT